MRLNSFASTAAIVAAVAGIAAFSGAASAASNVGATSASADLDFRVTIPSVVFLQVGAGSFKQNDTDVDEIAFAPTPAEFTALNPVAGTGGNLGSGKVTVRVFGNTGPLALSSTATTLTSGGDTIPWSEITVAANGGVPHPAFTDTGVMSTPLTTNGNGNSRVTNLQGDWTYTYDNSAEVAEGVYLGTVTYTVATP